MLHILEICLEFLQGDVFARSFMTGRMTRVPAMVKPQMMTIASSPYISEQLVFL
jgi:hypothetical protein